MATVFVGIDCSVPQIIDIKEREFPDYKKSSPLHLTLKFLGDCDDDRIREISDLLSKVRHDSFRMRTTKFGTFDKPDAAGLIYLGVENSAQVRGLQQKIDRVLSSLYEPERRFTPHITLARFRPPINVTSYLAKTPEIVSMPVTEFAVYVKEKEYKKYKRFSL